MLRRRVAALVAALLTIAPASVALTWVGPAAAADYDAIPDYATLLADWNGADGVNTFTLAPAFDQNVTDAAHFEMQAGDDFTLDLNGGSLTFTTLTVIGGGGNPYIDEMPAIEVPQGATLTIDGPGTLTVTGAAGAAGIGSRSGYLAWEYDAGTVVINGGTVTANGGGAYDGNIGERFGGAGIGGGNGGDGGTTVINGGTVIANGSTGGAGIGGGRRGHAGTGAGGGTIIVNGGTVTANAGDGAGLGGGNGGGVGSVTINGGTVDAAGNTGIGAGLNVAQGGPITINGGTVTAAGQYGGAGIGGGGNQGVRNSGDAGRITITGGVIRATGGGGIGGGVAGAGGQVSISGGDISASPRIGAGGPDAYGWYAAPGTVQLAGTEASATGPWSVPVDRQSAGLQAGVATPTASTPRFVTGTQVIGTDPVFGFPLYATRIVYLDAGDLVAHPSATQAAIGDTITWDLAVQHPWLTGTTIPVTSLATATSDSGGASPADTVSGNTVTFNHASTHTITVTYGGIATTFVVAVSQPAIAAAGAVSQRALAATGLEQGQVTVFAIAAAALLIAGLAFVLLARRRRPAE